MGSSLRNPAVLLCALLVPTLVISRPTIVPGECPTAAALPLDSHCIEPLASTGIPKIAVYEHTPHSSALTVYVDSLQQMTRKAKATIAVLSTLIAYVSINSIIHVLRPAAFVWSAEDWEERSWIASSRSWFDRKSCRWLGICGAAHIQTVHGEFGNRDPAEWVNAQDAEPEAPWRSFWLSGTSESEWDAEERARRQIPDYVFHYAPLVHLYSGEQFWPGDIAEHLHHTTPTLNYTPIQAQWDHPTLADLDDLNKWGPRHVFLTSNDDVQTRPPWLEGDRNIPQTDENHKEESWADWDGRIDGDIPGDTEEDRAKWYDFYQLQQEAATVHESNADEHFQAQQILKEEIRRRYGGEEIYDGGAGGRSDAPAILVVMDKGNGIVDAFWFYFYSFNLGNTVVNVRFGNHVGDWEHCLVRFHNGKPKALFFSAHQGGEAYSYEAVEKIGQRPVIYSAEGSHAMYATAGVHEYLLPWGLLHDVTDRGPLWDPLLNSQAYTYDFDSENLRASTFSPSAPTEWFHYRGHWGDKFYPLGDTRQYRFAGQYHFVNGPLGPKFKHLDRHKVCQGPDRSPCVIKNYIEKGKRPRRWGSSRPGE